MNFSRKFTLCTLCLGKKCDLVDPFEYKETGFKLQFAIKEVLQFKVSDGGRIPWVICRTCIGKLKEFWKFKSHAMRCMAVLKFVFIDKEESTDSTLEDDAWDAVKTEVDDATEALMNVSPENLAEYLGGATMKSDVILRDAKVTMKAEEDLTAEVLANDSLKKHPVSSEDAPANVFVPGIKTEIEDRSSEVGADGDLMSDSEDDFKLYLDSDSDDVDEREVAIRNSYQLKGVQSVGHVGPRKDCANEDASDSMRRDDSSESNPSANRFGPENNPEDSEPTEGVPNSCAEEEKGREHLRRSKRTRRCMRISTSDYYYYYTVECRSRLKVKKILTSDLETPNGPPICEAQPQVDPVGESDLRDVGSNAEDSAEVSERRITRSISLGHGCENSVVKKKRCVSGREGVDLMLRPGEQGTTRHGQHHGMEMRKRVKTASPATARSEEEHEKRSDRQRVSL